MAKHFKFYQRMVRTKQTERKSNRQGVLVSRKKGKKEDRKGEKKESSRMSSNSVPQTQDSGVGTQGKTQEVPVDVHMEEDGGEGRTPRKRRPVQRYADTWESPLSALTPSPSPMTRAVRCTAGRSTVGSKGPLLLHMPQTNEVLKLTESSRRLLFGEDDQDDDDDEEEQQLEEEEEAEEGLDESVEQQLQEDESGENDDDKEEDEAKEEEVTLEKRTGRNYRRLLQLAKEVGKTQGEQRRPDKGGKFL